jgi:hypothetical protein
MMQPSAGSQPNPKAKQFAQDYAGQVSQILEKLKGERVEPYPQLTGRVGTAMDDPSRLDNYV